jgi:hypothetical protein
MFFGGGMAKHPDWATKHRTKGTELRFINGKYYLYEVSSKWNAIKKRSQKISGKLLGRITEKDGFIPSDKNKLRNKFVAPSDICVKEYGVAAFINTHFQDYIQLLKKHFKEHAEVILLLAYCRLIFQSPLKNAEFHYLNSFLSEMFPGLNLSASRLSGLMREIGTKRSNIVEFFKEFMIANDHIIFDGTDVLCNSKNMDISKMSKSKKNTFDNVANIMMAFSTELQLPIYYRLVPGNIKDIKSFKLSIQEAKMDKAVVIADKGFYSKENLISLKNESLSFIIPIKRNNAFIDYEPIKTNDNKKMKFFFFEKRVIWYYSIKQNDEIVTVYLDDEMKTIEKKDYLLRTASLPEEYNMDKFVEKQHQFGTIALLHNLDKSEEEIFIDYKSRMQIETMIDALKNVLEADSSYMHNEQSMETWMLINYIALHWYYRLLQILKTNKLNKKFSPMDFLKFLREIKKVRINGIWHNSEITKKYSDILISAGIHIT